MRKESVEIFSDATNAPIMRHPGRRFPGVLIQGDELHAFCQSLDRALAEMSNKSEAYYDVNDLRNRLWDLKNHYNSVLTEHGITLPFSKT